MCAVRFHVRRPVAAAGRAAVVASLVFAGPVSAQEALQNQNLTRPISTVEVGLADVSKSSFKAGEYNGLEKKGGVGIGHVDLRGGGAYNSDSAARWRVKAVDLGVEGRNLYAEAGVQGRSRFTVVYDELLRNRSDSYQSIFNGVGTNSLTLPTSWLVPTIAGATAASSAVNITSARGLVPGLGTGQYIDINTASSTLGGVIRPTAAQMSLVNAASAADLPAFQNANLSTKRTRVDVLLDVTFNPQWGFDAALHPEHKTGMKPLGAISRATGGDIASIIPDLIDSQDNRFDANLHFKGGKSYLQAGVAGSVFNNHVPSMTFQNWALGPTNALTSTTMSSAPSNTFGQLNLTGGYHPTPATHLTANGSYGRTTQNDAFLIDNSMPVVPVNSLNGLVVTTAFNAKATTKIARRLQMTAAYKFDDRDNRSAVNTFMFMDANQPLAANAAFAPGVALATNVGQNRSYSRKVNQLTGDVDLKLGALQSVRGGYEFEKNDRWCNGAWIDCANAATTSEHRGHADYRLNVRDDVVVRAGYAYGTRRGDYNENSFLAMVPLANVSPMAATNGMTYYKYLVQNGLNGWGPALGFSATTGNANVFFPANSETHLSAYGWENRIAELPGLRRYDVANRRQGKARASLDWQASEELSFSAGVDADTSDYPDSRYGVQRARTNAATLDGTYAFGAMSANLYYTFEQLRSDSAGNTLTNSTNATNVLGMTALSNPTGCGGYTTLQQRNNNNKLDPCLDWTTARKDLVHTVGFGLDARAGALVLSGNAILSRARSDQDFTGGVWVNNILIGPGAAPTNVAAVYVPATPMPAVTTNSAEVRANGLYALTPRMSLRLAYAYLWMQSDDYAYQGLQLGASTIVNVLPTNEQAFNHGVHVFGASYVFSF